MEITPKRCKLTLLIYGVNDFTLMYESADYINNIC